MSLEQRHNSAWAGGLLWEELFFRLEWIDKLYSIHPKLNFPEGQKVLQKDQNQNKSQPNLTYLHLIWSSGSALTSL